MIDIIGFDTDFKEGILKNIYKCLNAIWYEEPDTKYEYKTCWFDFIEKIVSKKEFNDKLNEYCELYCIKNQLNKEVESGLKNDYFNKIIGEFLLYCWEKITFEHSFKDGNKRIGYILLMVARENYLDDIKIIEWLGEN